MKSITVWRRVLALAASGLAASGQQTVAPTREPVGEARGANSGNYNITQDWELGYRWREVGGNLGKYRSDVNFGNGMRLLASRLAVFSRDGKGGVLDELTLSTQGLGNDPYESAVLRIAKNRVYRYDGLWRSGEYYNPALAVAGGLHAMDTTRRLQDHDITLLPQSRVRFFTGFSRVTQAGPALATVNAFDGPRGDEFALFADVRRRQNEFRFGNEVRVAGVKVNWMQSWEMYRERAPQDLGGAPAGANVADRTALESFLSREPVEGKTPSFRLSLFRERGERWALNGRFTHSGGRRDFTMDESAVGVDRFGAARNRQVVVAGNARRPVTTGSLTVSVFPASRLTLTNHTSLHTTRMEGDSTYTEMDNGTLEFSSVNFRYLGIRGVTNVSDAGLQVRPWLALRGGVQISDRLVRSVERVEIDGFPAGRAHEQSNRLKAGSAGFRLNPAKGLVIAADGELGRQDRAFYTTSEKDYHALSARLRYKNGPLSISAQARSYSNFNSVSLFAHSAQGRTYAADGSWTPRDWFSFDAGYTNLRVSTATGISYFLGAARVDGESSLYRSNLHTGHLGLRVGLGSRADLVAGLSVARDAAAGAGTRPAAPVFGAVQAFPMEYDAPLARLSVKLHSKLRWNIGYQYYRYREDLLAAQNYRAHTGFTSVLWTF